MIRVIRWPLPVLARLTVSLGLLILLAAVLDTAQVISLLRSADPVWLLPALVIALLQAPLSAWRWRFTARRLGLVLRFPHAVREYYLAIFLNQVLPGGVMGDAARAWRHGRSVGSPGPAVRAVILERASGQAAMALVVALALISGGGLLTGLGSRVSTGMLFQAGALLLAVAVLACLALHLTPERLLRKLGRDVHRALLARDALPAQIFSSTLLAVSYLVVFVMVALAIGLQVPIPTLAFLAALTLLAMLIPLSIAGWGVREGAAALLWPLAGLSAAEGVAASVAYGLLILLASLPGAFFLLAEPRSGR